MGEIAQVTFRGLHGSRISLFSRSDLSQNLSDLSRKSGMLMISMKSRKFSKGLIEEVLEFSSRNFQGTSYTIVDLPYAYNSLADSKSLEEMASKIEHLSKIRDEVLKRVNKVVNKAGILCKYIPWSDLVAETPCYFENEVYHASRNDQFFRDKIFSLVETALDKHESTPNIESYTMFFLSELPCLLYIYSGLRGDIIDFYPGENPDLIWEIMNGQYVNSMPMITNIFKDNRSFIFATVEIS